MRGREYAYNKWSTQVQTERILAVYNSVIAEKNELLQVIKTALEV
jgi:hypothetical protein